MFKKLCKVFPIGELLKIVTGVIVKYCYREVYIYDWINSIFSMFKKLGSLNVSKWKAGPYRSLFGIVGIDPIGIIRKGLVLGEFYETKRISS